MEKLANDKVAEFVGEWKQRLFDCCAQAQSPAQVAAFVAAHLQPMVFTREDLTKKKRPKSFVPMYDRCQAKRATTEQCTRRKKEGCAFCGTHVKGTPYGVVDPPEEILIVPPQPQQQEQQHQQTQDPPQRRVEVWAQDIRGIVYYIDAFGHVFDTEDVLRNQANPKIVARYEVRDDQYVIPDFL